MQFQIRYNPLDDANGKYPFWVNTEWFDGRYERSRTNPVIEVEDADLHLSPRFIDTTKTKTKFFFN